MASSSKFRLSKSQIPTPSTPLSNNSYFISPNPTFSKWNITPTPHAPLSYDTPAQAATPCPKKRKKENQPLFNALPILNSDEPKSKKRAYRVRRTTTDKLTNIFEAIRDVNWTLGDFLFYTFQTKDESGKDVPRTIQHSMYATNFLQGRTAYTPGIILECWYRSSDGRVPGPLAQEFPMFTTTLVYTKIKPARAALTAFAAQLVEQKLVQEAKKAVQPQSGLHATSKKNGTQKVEWADVGASTASHVETIIKRYQPLTWRLLNRIAGEKDGEVVRKRRLTSIVCTHVIASLDFARNNEARLLPLARAFLFFAYSAPVDLMAYSSRIGEMPAYTTVQNALKGLANHEKLLTKAHARDLMKLGFLQFDNVQNYSRKRDHRIGSSNKMNIGIAATYCELEDPDLSAVDLGERRKLVLEDKRSKLTIDNLLSLIDQKHLDTVFSLHWLRVLINSIPELSKWKPHVTMLFHERASKLQLPIKPTKVHPLASSGKNETVTTELKDALIDFFDQMGQTESDYIPRVLFAGGDGLTFQKMLEVQRYLQFHGDPFRSLELLEPVLSLWHTEWTDLSRVFEVHWDSILSPDPSSLGHSAAKINRAGPSSLKKVDYYPAADLAYLVLDVRILDCWRNHFKCNDIFAYFSELHDLPEIEDLIEAAHTLHRSFSSTRAIYHALDDTTLQSEWSKNVLRGSVWTPPPIFKSSQDEVKKFSKKEKPTTRHPQGDRVLANSITFMRDALISREMSYAIAEGDPGRVYEIMKARVTQNTLEAIVEKKGVEYGDTFIREVISRNLHHFARIKLDLRVGVGLSQRSGRHSAPHLDPEIRILLEAYKNSELHLLRPGRVYIDTDKDQFQSGIVKLREGKLKKWISDTTRTRNLLSSMQPTMPVVPESESYDEDSREEEVDEPDSAPNALVFGEVIDGELVFSTVDTSVSEVDNWISHLEDIPAEYSSGEESDTQS